MWIAPIGRLPYPDGLALQQRVHDGRQAGVIPDTVLVLEHEPVYTRGRRSTPGELPMGEEWYADRGISIVDVNRGGRVTYHGPGQLVAYPIVAVDDVVAYLRRLEDAVVAALTDHGLEARSRADEGSAFTGVWVGERKIASIGVHLSRGVTTHGLAVNVDNDLTPFEWVVPCGLDGVAMTSIAQELGTEEPQLPCFRKRLTHRLAEALGGRQRLVTRARLDRALDGMAVS